jgi:hypothetical protein
MPRQAVTGVSFKWGYLFEVTPTLAASATWATLPASAFLRTIPIERVHLAATQRQIDLPASRHREYDPAISSPGWLAYRGDHGWK